MKTEVHIFKAADAFLYLPAYIAQELKIYASLLKDYDVTIHYPEIVEEGDVNAIKRMLDCHESSLHARKNIIPICICDPIAFLSKKNIKDNYNIEQCLVLGALINKIPFWAVDSNKAPYCNTFDELCKRFTDVIHYDKDLTTGYQLGKNFISKRTNCTPYEVNKIGEEFIKLKEVNEVIKNSGQSNRKAIVLTADIVRVATGLWEIEEKIATDFSLNYKFSNEIEKFISTGILTTKYAAEKDENKEIISKIIEGIQKSISIIECSEEIATTICLKVADKKKLAKIDANIARKIIETMNDEGLYPADLSVNETAWNNSIITLGKIEEWEEDVLNNTIDSSYKKHVNSSFLQNSQREISKQFGISTETFSKEIDDIISIEIEAKNTKIKELQKKLRTNIIDEVKKYLRICAYFVVGVGVLYFAFKSFEEGNLAEFGSGFIINFAAGIAMWIFSIPRKQTSQNQE